MRAPRPVRSARLAIVRPRLGVRGCALVLLFASTPAVAGTICGSVRDRVTNQPIARAGVFVRDTTGVYTGLYGATDAAGWFCIGSVPPGRYDLEVKVDDYQVAYARVLVPESPVSVEIPGSFPPLSLSAPWPNPARARVHLRWQMREPATIRLAVFDVRGRLIHAWIGRDEASGAREIEWDLRNGDGEEVPPGPYMVRLDTPTARRTRSFVKLR